MNTLSEIKSPILKEKYKEKVEERKQQEKNNSKIDTLSGINSPSLKERYKDKVEERRRQENRNSKTENPSRITSPSLKDRYREKIEGRERKYNDYRSDSYNRIKSPLPPQSRNSYSERDRDQKSRYHHHNYHHQHHHHHHHNYYSNSIENSSRSYPRSSITLNNEVYDPRIINGMREKVSIKYNYIEKTRYIYIYINIHKS